MDESERETADTNGEGETLPDPQGAEVSAWERERDKWNEKEKVKKGEWKYVAWLQKTQINLIFIYGKTKQTNKTRQVKQKIK